jgi:hypothetical protein
MRLDSRGLILSLWLTLFSGTVSSTLVLNYFTNTRGGTGLPTTLAETGGLLAGLWLGAALSVLMIWITGWATQLSQVLWTALVGYWIGAFIRLILLGEFLPGADSQFNVLWQALTFQALPAHDAWWLLVLFGGVMVVLVVGVLATLIPPVPATLTQGALNPPGRVVASVVGLGFVLMLLLIGLRSLNQDLAPEFSLRDTRWLLLPQTNMLLAALLGFLVGGSYLCQDRYQAASALFIGLCLHVCLMLLLDALLAPYDPLNSDFNPNRVALLPFLFLWWGVPTVGAIAAFALHNLRDAFSLPEEVPQTSVGA